MGFQSQFFLFQEKKDLRQAPSRSSRVEKHFFRHLCVKGRNYLQDLLATIYFSFNKFDVS